MPITINTISLKPPMPFSLALITSTFHRLFSANFEYIRNKSAAKRAASSPPAPPRISTITFLSSLGSLGSISILSSCSHSATFSLQALSSSLASSLISSSFSSSRIARLSSMPSFASLYSLYLLATGDSSLCSLISSLYCSWLLITSGSVSSIFISSSLLVKSSNLSNIIHYSFQKYTRLF